MRSSHVSLVCGLVVAMFFTAAPVVAELQNVTVGGEIRIRGNYYRNTFNGGTPGTFVTPALRVPGVLLAGGAIGDFIGGQSLFSFFDFDDKGPDLSFIEQRTRLNVTADFTDDVSVFIELDSYEIYGEDFRSSFVTGIDGRAASFDDLEIYQAYIDMKDIFGSSVSLRLGRQELYFGSGWLVGNNSALPQNTGLSFDGFRLTYQHDKFTLDAFWTKLLETSPTEEDGDIDFAGIYFSYTGVSDLVIDAYWFWIRDAGSIRDTSGGVFIEGIEDLLGVDDFDTTNMHTVGVRIAGTRGQFDFEAQAAYQFGNAGRIGSLFRPGLYSDDGADFGKFAFDAEAGYTFDVSWTPRLWAGVAWFQGEDNRHISTLDFLNPFDKPEASVSFNRLFSNKVYSVFLDEITELSNFWTLRGGFSANPTESVEIGLDVAYFNVIEEFDRPVTLFGSAVALPAGIASTESDDDLGIEAHVWIRYNYSEDLVFRAGWAHFFVDDGLEDGNFVDLNGLQFNGGTDDDDADYFYLESAIKF